MDPCSPAAFEARYQADRDPWRFATDADEQARYDAVVAVLGRDRYRSGYEPGCSIGVLTARLAPRCDQLLAVDVSATAVAEAARRCRDLLHVCTEVGSVADPRPDVFDLVVLSEVGYYFSSDELTGVLDGVLSSLSSGGELVACHWTGTSDDHVLSGATVHELIGGREELEPLRDVEGPAYLLGSWRAR